MVDILFDVYAVAIVVITSSISLDRLQYIQHQPGRRLFLAGHGPFENIRACQPLPGPSRS